MTGEDALGASRKYTDETVLGGGAVKGKNCTVSSITEADGVHKVTFSWTLDNGTVKTQTIEVKDGEEGYTPVKGVDYFDGEQGEKGDAGNGIIAITKTSTAGLVDTYTIVFDDGDTSTFNVVNGANITKVSELENDEEFIKATTINLTNYFLKTETYSKSQIDDLLRNVGAGLSVKIVTELPTGEEISGTTIYLINTSGANYNQYMYIDGSWANLGSTAVDMSSYYNKTQIDTKLEDYVTANRLTNKLDDYVEKDKLSKVSKSNSYNDLDDLPEIPDVSGIKPYVNVLQDSEETAPTSKALYNAVQTVNEEIDLKVDSAIVTGYINLDVGTDLNTLVDYGTYRTTTKRIDRIDNVPVQVAGMLEIRTTGGIIYQTYKTIDDEMYIRSSEDTGVTWADWQELATMDKVENKYSTDEVEIGSYMGEPLYRKCIIVEGTSDGEISLNNIKGLEPNLNVISLTGAIDAVSDGIYTFPVPYTLVDNNASGGFEWYRLYTYYYKTTGDITFSAKSSIPAYYKGKYKIKLIAEYTK